MKTVVQRWGSGLCALASLLFATYSLAGEIKSDLPTAGEAQAEKPNANSAPTTDLPPPGTESQPSDAPPFVPKEAVQIKVNVPATRLDLYVEGKLVKSYRIAVGMPKYPTPVGDYKISFINWNPWWLPPDSEWAAKAEKTPPGPGNPLGPVKMMMENGIRIHGTNAPGSIGNAASHACMRMKNSDAADLAWEIQQRYSEKNDPQLLETYKKNRKTPYWVRLGQDVPVTIEYKLVEQEGDKYMFYPDRYGHGGLQKALEEILSSYPDIPVDKDLINKLNKKRSKGILEITLSGLRDLLKPAVSDPGKTS